MPVPVQQQTYSTVRFAEYGIISLPAKHTQFVSTAQFEMSMKIAFLGITALASIQFGCAEKSAFIPQFSAAISKYGFSPKEPLETGSEVTHFNDHVEVKRPNVKEIEVHLNQEPSKLTVEDMPKQWLAWYFKSCLSGSTGGFESFSSDFIVPPLPVKASNLAIFNGLQVNHKKYFFTSSNYYFLLCSGIL